MSTVLFVCANNGGRSQIAEAAFNRLCRESGCDDQAESAGTRSVGVVHPLVLKAMEFAGLPTEGCAPKPLTPEMIERADRIITMDDEIDAKKFGADFAVSERWQLPDPCGKPMGSVMEIRDQIIRKVETLWGEVGQPGPTP